MRKSAQRVCNMLHTHIDYLQQPSGLLALTWRIEEELYFLPKQVVHALQNILEEPQAFEIHYMAFIALRSYFERDLIPASRIRALTHTFLETTKKMALRYGTDEWYKSITAVVRVRKASPALRQFVEKELLDTKDTPDWPWISFSALAALLCHEPITCSRMLRRKLQNALEQEHEPSRKMQMQTILNLLG